MTTGGKAPMGKGSGAKPSMPDEKTKPGNENRTESDPPAGATGGETPRDDKDG